jgi:outer membrane protein assembly factor BamB
VSCQSQNKAYNWSYETGGPILGDPVVDSTGIYVASLDRSLYKLNKNTGWPLWRVRFPKPLETGPVAAGNTVYQFCIGQGITALDSSSGKELWRHAEATAFASHNEAGDVLLTAKRTLDVVDPATGQVRASVSAPAVLKSVVNPYSPAVYLLGTEGRVLAVQLDSVPYLRRQQIMAARRNLNQPPSKESALIRAERAAEEEPDPLENDPLRSRRDLEPKSDKQ